MMLLLGCCCGVFVSELFFIKDKLSSSNNLTLEHARRRVGPGLVSNCLQAAFLSVDDT